MLKYFENADSFWIPYIYAYIYIYIYIYIYKIDNIYVYI